MAHSEFISSDNSAAPLSTAVREEAQISTIAPRLNSRRRGRLALLVFRLPLPLYRFGFGWVLGHAFLQLTHVGRRTGKAHGGRHGVGPRPEQP